MEDSRKIIVDGRLLTVDIPEKYKIPKHLTVTSMIVEYAKYFSLDPDSVADRINQMDYYALKVLLAQQYVSQLYIHLKYYSPKK